MYYIWIKESWFQFWYKTLYFSGPSLLEWYKSILANESRLARHTAQAYNTNLLSTNLSFSNEKPKSYSQFKSKIVSNKK